MTGDAGDLVERFFDDYGEREWERLDVDVRARVAFELHRRFVARFVTPGARVLEIGAGAGRFTIELVRLGAAVHVGDVSRVQLDLNARYVGDAGCEHGVVARQRLDVRDLDSFDDSSFDVVVAYGGPLNYAFDRAASALNETLRVVRPGGPVVASVLTLAGTLRVLLRFFRPTIDRLGLECFERFLASGDQRLIAAAGAHPCRLLRWSDLQQMVEDAGAQVVAASASNWLSLGPLEVVEALAEDPELWARFLDWEERLCAEPGAVEGGTHLLFAARRTSRSG